MTILYLIILAHFKSVLIVLSTISVFYTRYVVCRSHVVVRRRSEQQHHVLRQPQISGAFKRRGRVLVDSQKNVRERWTNTFGFYQLQSGMITMYSS